MSLSHLSAQSAAASPALMRKRYSFSLSASGRWPDVSVAENGGVGALGLFNWVRVENRDAANPVLVLNGQDANDYVVRVPAGMVRVFNVAGPRHDPQNLDAWWNSIYVTAPSGATAVVLEISDHPIVDQTQPAH